VTFSDPWLLGSRFRLDIPVQYLRREEPSFTRRELGTGLNVHREWTSRFSTVVGYSLRSSASFDLDVDAPLEDLEADVRIGSVRAEGTYDTRNALFDPRRGHRLDLRIERAAPAFGSQIDFLRLQATASKAFPLGPRFTLAAGVRSGWIEPLGSTDVIPLQERFFNGGENTVRSFRESELGPKDFNGDPIGGEVMNVANLELRYHFARRWQAAVFYDTGNVALTTSDWFEDFRAGAGVGLRYILPVGSIRADVGVNPNPRDDEDRAVFHLSIGMAF
ncbi:MAG TPA: outer membrane protein assembly factor, partial [Candidatus Polarisedimenticolia bacterium]|nr:outer membrane protein assembly factor [Candidatus Polarisedimenticolia bacterium]